jgi:hypothetical protein
MTAKQENNQLFHSSHLRDQKGVAVSEFIEHIDPLAMTKIKQQSIFVSQA